jgi:hypothetical protein
MAKMTLLSRARLRIAASVDVTGLVLAEGRRDRRVPTRPAIKTHMLIEFSQSSTSRRTWSLASPYRS